MRSLLSPRKRRLLAVLACTAVTCSMLSPAEAAAAEGAVANPVAADGATPDGPTADRAATEPAATEPAEAAPAAGDPVATAVEAAPLAPSGAVVPARHPMMAAIDAALQREASLVRELQSQLAQAPDGMAALAIQRQIDAQKQQTEIAILELQLERARSDGRSADAEHLATTLEQLRHPQVPRRAVERRSPHQD